MALTVETGSGSSTADALVSLAGCNTYHAALGNSDWTGTDADKEAAIRRATAVLSHGFSWAGLRSHGRSQALAWPRSGCVDAEGYGIASDTIPVEIIDACCEIALREIVSPGSVVPDVTPSEAVKREKVGSLEVEYVGAATSPAAHRPVMALVGAKLQPFLATVSGEVFGKAVRA